MSYVVYGLRLRGEREVRYIGLTRRGLKYRLQRHVSCSTRSWPRQAARINWLKANRHNVEIFEIERIPEIGASFEQRTAAFAAERAAIEAFTNLGHRLFNQTHVPYRLRIAA